ncbi:uncharacterized protein LOC115409523 [Salarias fasciatus]|uniref:uncharacterized protein LOC115409523 n=1 Tax=Salarias fasciatus TaxID=181472 RepID=UPI001176DD17|nr:uncharacterized protein LOC115409523 [Salarias fasciatus]
MLEWCRTRETKLLMDEMFHSIFFLAKINIPPFSPEEIIPDKEMLQALLESYPKPVKHLSQLPRRSPFSCVLDMVVLVTGQQNEDQIKNQLQQFVQQLGGDTSKAFLSTTMCVSQIKGKDSVRHYGVSMSTSGPVAGRIMVATSCLQTWHKDVAGAVLSYDQRSKEMPLRSYFNGTIRLPQNIRCEAYNIRDKKPKPPCKSCGNLFGFTNSEGKQWPYGNCAEVESLSKLLTTEAVQVQFQKDNPGDREKAVEEVRTELKNLLSMIHHKWDGKFYVPQSI